MVESYQVHLLNYSANAVSSCLYFTGVFLYDIWFFFLGTTLYYIYIVNKVLKVFTFYITE